MADDAEDRVLLWATERTNWFMFVLGLLNGSTADERMYSAVASPRGLLVRDPHLRRLSATGGTARGRGQRFLAWDDIEAVDDVFSPVGPWFLRITTTDGSRVELSVRHLTATSSWDRATEARTKTSTVVRMMDRYRAGDRPDGDQ